MGTHSSRDREKEWGNQHPGRKWCRKHGRFQRVSEELVARLPDVAKLEVRLHLPAIVAEPVASRPLRPSGARMKTVSQGNISTPIGKTRRHVSAQQGGQTQLAEHGSRFQPIQVGAQSFLTLDSAIRPIRESGQLAGRSQPRDEVPVDATVPSSSICSISLQLSRRTTDASTNESTDLSPRLATHCSSLQRRLVVVAGSFS